MPVFNNVQMTCLPPNTTSTQQPLDAGTTSALKRRYIEVQYEHLLDALSGDVPPNKVYYIDQLTPIGKVDVWRNIPSTIFPNCWKHTGLCGRFNDDNLLDDNAEGIGENISNRISFMECTGLNGRMPISAILNFLDEDRCESLLSLNGLVTMLASEVSEDLCKEISAEEEGDLLGSINMSEKHKAVFLTKVWLLWWNQKSVWICARMSQPKRRRIHWAQSIFPGRKKQFS